MSKLFWILWDFVASKLECDDVFVCDKYVQGSNAFTQLELVMVASEITACNSSFRLSSSVNFNLNIFGKLYILIEMLLLNGFYTWNKQKKRERKATENYSKPWILPIEPWVPDHKNPVPLGKI